MQIQEHTAAQIRATVTAAAQVADDWAQSSAQTRASLLRGLGDALIAHREALVSLGDDETSLGPVRLNGELERTNFQLRAFADHVEAGHAFAVSEDAAIVGAPPLGRPHLTRVRIPLGPVAMFSASNFPFAFSVLGGDTASALAAGCPVVIKAHPGHPRLSRKVFELARSVLAQQGLPEGLLGMVEGAGVDVGVELVRSPDIAAVAFTGSFKGGTALWAQANSRPRPIPFYGELGSINPVVAMPSALAAQAEELAQNLAASIEFGSGQVCTSPGLVVLLDSADADRFESALRDALQSKKTHAMLTPAMKRNFDAGVARLIGTPGVQTILAGESASEDHAPPRPVLARTSAKNFVAQHALHEEIFGPACLLVRAGSTDEIVEVLNAVGGSLTVTIWGAQSDSADARRITRCATQIAGRVLFSGVPTGVAVTGSQQHGGPWPASTQPFTTSVGCAAMDRFLRPVALQSAPAWLAEREGQPC
ncbi:NADP-dependent fatty aldehyde dehydrogenase [Paraburkholderia ribeironis]|uniref:NADP-dependent fatty aldehyde dehydrogenase n=1 Tax=Paraburkholderia ribeironis TaxID=1247936 RepID=A0A1N7S941_9BURK|nr:aldehyde dehydrogenase (NADP(+)) [Paraburkholderia ribeironis]SIT43862.1 NADP-dependent fatty aldehyde dehydrogenase [Paraburkholderia ribeironis]